tara:strand:- start:174 stop:731 length:558 start_codon:yes stop_codon:yes gene_type:complete
MIELMRSFFRTTVVFSLVFLLASCGGAASAGLNSFQSQDGRYAFLYPNGWTRVAVQGGPQVVFHDLINSDETLSLVVSKVDSNIDLELLGNPEMVGQRLMNEVIAPEGTGRDVELVSANSRKSTDHTFYDLEYSVRLEDRDRHELATVVIDKGYLYTLATSTNEKRWPKVKGLFEKVITSLTFLI